MVKTQIHTFQKMNKDLTESKTPTQFYYDAKNIRFITNDEVITGGFSFEKGNDLVLTIPVPIIDSINNRITYNTADGLKELPYAIEGSVQPRSEIERQYYISSNVYRTSGEQIIIGHTVTRDYIILFTTDDNGFDCIWRVNDEDYSIDLIYMRNMEFSKNNPIQALNNYENEIINKVYWVDGKAQLRFLNILQSIQNGDLEELIDLPVDAINSVSGFDLSQPVITNIIGGGSHTSGKIQYAYNLFRLNNSQTKLSPLSELVSLTKGPTLGGGAINESVGATPIVEISDIDENYTHIRIYAVKYTSYNQLPSVSLIYERELGDNTSVTYFDDGSIIESISIEEFLFLGSDIIIPKHINTKENIMFLSNYKERTFDLNLDVRAYSFNSASSSVIYDNVRANTSGTPIGDFMTVPSTFIVPPKFDAVNLNYDVYRYQQNGITLGGEGKYLKYELSKTTENLNRRFFKDEEIYRIGIQFYNRKGQNTLPKWIADFKAPEGNLKEEFNTLTVTLKAEFYAWLNDPTNFESEDDKPIGYKVLRADRQLKDRTIIASGMLTPMMVNDRNTGNTYDINGRRNASKINPKMPNILVRRFDDGVFPLRAAEHMQLMTIDSGLDTNYQTEIHYNGSVRVASTYQFNSMMQLYSPEIIFDNLSFLPNGLSLRVKGGLKNTYNAYWGQERNVADRGARQEGKVFNGISPFASNDKITIIGDVNNLVDEGLIAHPGGSDPDVMAFDQYYRVFGKYNGSINYFKSSVEPIVSVYGIPEVTERGQGVTTYNNDNNYQYTNSLQGLLTDGNDDYDDTGVANRSITSVNSWGSKAITFVTGADNPAIEHWQRPTMESIKTQTTIPDNDIVLIGELIIPNEQIYLGNIYGGNAFEDKKRTNYIEIGEYKKIDENINIINSPGDTYINNFNFERISKTDTEVYSQTVLQYSEIVSFTTETTIELTSRNDTSLSAWDTRFQPRFEDYHKYNRVYSQQSNLILRRDTDYKFKKTKAFDTNVIATKTKVPGEIIDSWTDLLLNEVLTLDGKHGPINSLTSFKDELYTFQDKGISRLSILPRVQVQGDDGLSVELGTGSILAKYSYLTTNSGSINKWGIMPTETGIYYLDALNKSFNLIGEKFIGLSDMEGFHKFFLDNIIIDYIKQDNPIIGRGVSMGWDKVTNDVYLTINGNGRNSGESRKPAFTIAFNLAQQGFSSFYNYDSGMYIPVKGKMLTVNPFNNDEIYECFIGDYNVFYQRSYKSSIDFVVNPEPYVECTFNNLEYKSEAFNNDNIEQRYTWERIKIYNEFQNSNLVALQERSNIRKLNRKWRLNIPRNKNKTNRIRNTWAIIHLEATNENNYRYRNHDIIVYYNPNNKIIQ